MSATSEVSHSDLSVLPTYGTARITNVEHLASYNWIEAPIATIAVPGGPPVWSPANYSKQVKKDSGHVYIAQNAARHPESPMEPLFRALFIERPEFNISETDLVSDRNNIRKLLAFVDPATSTNSLESFTIRAEFVEGTVIFCRDEAKVQEFIGKNEFRGFGHEFEKAYTKPTVSKSTGHHRIISYVFCDRRFLIRHETDGYVDARGAPAGKYQEGDMIDLLRSLSLNEGLPTGEGAAASSKLTVWKTGIKVPLTSTLEIKTRVVHKPLSIDEAAPQLWVSQTPKLVRAYHKRGVFDPPSVEDVTALVKEWEEKNEEALQKLGALIHRIIEVVKEYACATIRLVPEDGKLIIGREEARNMLPRDLYSKWTDAMSSDLGRPDADEPCATGVTESVGKNRASVSSETEIQMGNDAFSIPLHKFPYLMALFQQLCNTYGFLRVDVLEGQSLDDLIINIKAGKRELDLGEKGDKRLARDSAFRLVYYILTGESHFTKRESDQIYNAVLYIVSHPGTFKHKARNIVRAVYEDRFQCSAKQMARLHDWKKREDPEDDGETTASSFSDVYLSSDS
ncbi:hypothetical protein CBER1_11868 [Cercospora berteroae]|uniref:Geranylgeranyl pyrophosphate synthetase n=1 Tax=Cercospora berteroae TaxID=357750 RepID=A0A2S6CE34_9PEZI|nr:hypothetical protein CBER1_11868 [Cercospora berteroae]